MRRFVRVPRGGASNKDEVRKTKLFSGFMGRYLQNGTCLRDTTKVTGINDYTKLHMRFQLAPRSMTLNNKFNFSRNFALLRTFGRPVYQGCRALTFALASLSCNVMLGIAIFTLINNSDQFQLVLGPIEYDLS